MGANLAGLIAIVSPEAAAGIMHRAGGHRGPADFLHCGGKWIRTIGPPPEIVVDPSGSRRDHMKISLELKGFVRGAGSADANLSSPRRAATDVMPGILWLRSGP